MSSSMQANCPLVKWKNFCSRILGVAGPVSQPLVSSFPLGKTVVNTGSIPQAIFDLDLFANVVIQSSIIQLYLQSGNAGISYESLF
jgi:hypothetical protein